MKKPDGGPAFPGEMPTGPHGTWSFTPGMSLRAYFAGQALAGLLANPILGSPVVCGIVAQDAVIAADVLIAELEKETP